MISSKEKKIIKIFNDFSILHVQVFQRNWRLQLRKKTARTLDFGQRALSTIATG